MLCNRRPAGTVAVSSPPVVDLGGASLSVGDSETQACGMIPEQLVECLDVTGDQGGLVPVERGADLRHDRRPVDRYLVGALRGHFGYPGHRVGSAATWGSAARSGISSAAGSCSSGICAGAGVLLKENARQTAAANR
jgi:hypothetical protein